MHFNRLDYMKIDVEGMEQVVFAEAMETVSKFKPILFIENNQSNQENLAAYLAQHGCKTYDIGMKPLAIHVTDPAANHSTIQGDSLNFTA